MSLTPSQFAALEQAVRFRIFALSQLYHQLIGQGFLDAASDAKASLAQAEDALRGLRDLRNATTEGR